MPDLTSFGRLALLFYSMPVRTGTEAHLFLPGERATPVKGLGPGLRPHRLGHPVAQQGRGRAGQPER